VCWSTAAATLLAAGNANAAQEVAELAAGDNRTAIIATLFLPVVGWVCHACFSAIACLAQGFYWRLSWLAAECKRCICQ